MDFKALLKKYMEHVIDREGISFASKNFISTKRFTLEEQAYLIELGETIAREEEEEYVRRQAAPNIP